MKVSIKKLICIIAVIALACCVFGCTKKNAVTNESEPDAVLENALPKLENFGKELNEISVLMNSINEIMNTQTSLTLISDYQVYVQICDLSKTVSDKAASLLPTVEDLRATVSASTRNIENLLNNIDKITENLNFIKVNTWEPISEDEFNSLIGYSGIAEIYQAMKRIITVFDGNVADSISLVSNTVAEIGVINNG